METRNMQQNQQYYVDCIERLNGGAIDRLSWAVIRQFLDDLTENTPLVIQSVESTAKFARGRKLKSDAKIATIKELGYPSADRCRAYGRCNTPHNPVLYAGIGTELVLSEIGAQTGDIVGLLHMSPNKTLNLIRLGAINLWRRTNGLCLLAEDIKNQIKNIHKVPENITSFLLDAFISDYFSRPGSEHTYKLTSAYTDVVLSAHKAISGMIYESVDHTAGSCLALKTDVFDSFCQPTEVQIIKVTSYLGYGIYDFEVIHFSDSFDGDRIIWKN
jgi:hypothetical protein